MGNLVPDGTVDNMAATMHATFEQGNMIAAYTCQSLHIVGAFLCLDIADEYYKAGLWR
jgi:hypothetical protein